MATKKESKPKHSLHANRSNRVGGHKNRRSTATVRLLKMYICRPKRDAKGRIRRVEFGSRDLPSTRIQPDRRWFPPTRLISQKKLEGFREEYEKRASNNYNVMLNANKLPLSLLNNHPKSMETLVDLSASTLEKSDDVVCCSAKRGTYQETGPYYCYEKAPLTDYPGPRLMKRNGKEPREKSKDKSNLQSEILGALFTAPKKVEEERGWILPRARVRRSVFKPPKETKIEQSFVAVKPLTDAKDGEEEDENTFSVLRQAVREHWVTMKEYYKAAADAYTKGDKERASKFVKEGQFLTNWHKKLMRSLQKLVESRPDEEMLLDFSTFEPREGIRYLKVIVGDGQNRKGSLKRLVLKLLEKESIICTEAENGKTLVIRLDDINPETLSFAKQQEFKLSSV